MSCAQKTRGSKSRRPRTKVSGFHFRKLMERSRARPHENRKPPAFSMWPFGLPYAAAAERAIKGA